MEIQDDEPAEYPERFTRILSIIALQLVLWSSVCLLLFSAYAWMPLFNALPVVLVLGFVLSIISRNQTRGKLAIAISCLAVLIIVLRIVLFGNAGERT